jgi:5-dehydro-2-deoxygluconokinase
MMEKLLNIETSDDDYTASRWFSYRAELVVIKHGGAGSIAYTKDGNSHRSGIFKTNVLKSLGAGDSYASAFMYGLMTGKDVSEAMKMGSASASIVIARHSCSDAMPTEAELTHHMETAIYETV